MRTEPLNTVERARGRWREILPQLGIDTRFLTNRHGPCPLCGGKDRYRFDDCDGTGSYYCSQCGAGVGVILVRKLNGWDYATACREIDRIIGDSPPAANRSKKEPTADSKARAITRLLADANDSAVVDAYLVRRGLSVRSGVLQGMNRCPYFDADRKLLGHYPTVIAPIIGPDGSVQSAQRIYVADVADRKKAMPPVSTLNGGAVRLHNPADGALGVAEGIETSLAAHELFGLPVWAALTENGVQTFCVPSGVSKLVIFGDNDSTFVGQHAAYSLARRVAKAGVGVEVRIPPEPDTDWLDVLNRRCHG